MKFARPWLFALTACVLALAASTAGLAQTPPKGETGFLELGDQASERGIAAYDADDFDAAARHYADAAQFYQRAGGDLDHWRIVMLNNAAISLEQAGRLEQAGQFYGGVSRLLIDNNYAEPEELRRALAGWSRILVAQGRMTEALSVSEAALEWVERSAPPASETVIHAMSNRLSVLYALRRIDEAEQYGDTLLARVRSAGEPNPVLLSWALNTLADAKYQTGNFADAEALALESIAVTEAHYGVDAPQTAIPLLHLAGAVMRQGECENTLQLAERAGRLLERDAELQRLSTNHQLDLVAECQLELGRFDLAERASRSGLAFAIATFGEDSQPAIAARNNLAAILFRMGRIADSLEIHRENLVAARGFLVETHADVGLAHENVAEAAIHLGDHETAIRHFRQALDIYLAEYGEAYAETARARGNLAWALLEAGQPDDALGLVRQASRAVADRIAQGSDDLDARHRRTILETHVATAFALSEGEAP